MKVLLLYALLLYLLQIDGSSGETTYTTKYDGINLDEILTNDRLLNGYINCLLDQGACTPDGKELKGNIPDAISNDCRKCTERQKQGADQVMRYIIDHRPDDWAKLEDNCNLGHEASATMYGLSETLMGLHRYNSDGSYKRKYLESKQTTENKEDSSEKDD